MKAMVLHRVSDFSSPPLVLSDIDRPSVTPHGIVIKINACGVCHTELDEIEGRAMPAFFPIVPGHQVVGTVVERGTQARRFRIGDRVGVGWVFSTCGRCFFCRRGDENLCERFIATGKDVHGGYAEYIAVDERFAVPIPAAFTDVEAAPLLCAGAIGYRSLRLAGLQDGQTLGLVGFGASAHLVLQLVRSMYPAVRTAVLVRLSEETDFARQLGATWAGPYESIPPEPLDAVIDTTPAWMPVVKSLSMLRPGGRLVINAIRKEADDLREWLRVDYARDLWMEKEIKTVANVTRRDLEEFLPLAARHGIRPEVQAFDLTEANVALLELKQRKVRGGKVLMIK
jgi:propanol-preferring alcohol dehydrogenase